MHELGIAAEILRTARAALEGREGFRAERVVVRVGALEAVDGGSLSFAFEVLAREDPLFEGAELEVLAEKQEGSCHSCGWKGELEAPGGECPACGRAGLCTEGGFGITLESVEGEDPPEAKRARS